MFANGGETVALVADALSRLRVERATARSCLARKTEWQDAGDDRWFGLGQRVLATDAGEHDLMAVRSIELDDVPRRCRGGIVAGLTAQERLQPSLLDRLTDRRADTAARSRSRRRC